LGTLDDACLCCCCCHLQSPLVSFAGQLLQKAAVRMAMRSSSTKEMQLGTELGSNRKRKQQQEEEEEEDDDSDMEEQEDGACAFIICCRWADEGLCCLGACMTAG
jgi:hypothetical protein